METIHRSDVPALRKALSRLYLVIAECDEHLRYVWIDNPHPDFDAHFVVGKRDDELVVTAEAAPIMALKKQVLTTGRRTRQVIAFARSDGMLWYSIAAYPVYGSMRIEGVLTIGFEVDSPAAAGTC